MELQASPAFDSLIFAYNTQVWGGSKGNRGAATSQGQGPSGPPGWLIWIQRTQAPPDSLSSKGGALGKSDAAGPKLPFLSPQGGSFGKADATASKRPIAQGWPIWRGKCRPDSLSPKGGLIGCNAVAPPATTQTTQQRNNNNNKRQTPQEPLRFGGRAGPCVASAAAHDHSPHAPQLLRDR